jgi:hypothetical protein
MILDGRDQILQHGGEIEDTVDPHTRSRRDERRQRRKERELLEQIQFDPIGFRNFFQEKFLFLLSIEKQLMNDFVRVQRRADVDGNLPSHALVY